MRKQTNWICFAVLTSIMMMLFTYFYSYSVTVINEQLSVSRKNTVIIDAGHGGEDGGASSAEGTPESFYNLSIAVKIEKLLQFLGQETRMIRTNDISVYTEGNSLAQKKRSDLKERVRIVNSTENGLLLSIHQNTFPDGRYHGAQVFYANTHGSNALATLLQNNIVKTVNPGSSRKTKEARGIYLMEHIQRTGVLIECGFLSNTEEEILLRSDNYQKKLACVIAATVKEYLKSTENSNT